MKNILLICGGGGSEHEISLLSANYLQSQLSNIKNFNVLKVLITKEGQWLYNDCAVELTTQKDLIGNNIQVSIDVAIPCFHGFPGETGDIQSYFEMIKLPYFGCGPEASITCFNKVSTKLWLDAKGIQTTPWTFISSMDDIQELEKFRSIHGDVFLKASNQGSSVGCYPLAKNENPMTKLKDAFNYSYQILVEKSVIARELEVSVYEYNQDIIASLPGEIVVPTKFYSFEEKYSSQSKTTTEVVAKNIDNETQLKIQQTAIKAFKLLNLKHLARVDFFLTEDNKIYLNEINTFPGMTPISMFPKMLERNGPAFSSYLEQNVKNLLS